MAARLEWSGAELGVGPFCVGRVISNEETRTHHAVVEARGRWPVEDAPYESILDCMQDLESEVHRLLKKAGVEVDP